MFAIVQFIYLFSQVRQRCLDIKIYRKILSSLVSLVCETGPIPSPAIQVAVTVLHCAPLPDQIQEVCRMSDYAQWSCSRVVYLIAVSIWTLYHRTGGWFMETTCKWLDGFGSDIIEILFQAFACRDWRKPRNTSVKIAGVLVRIWTEFLTNTSAQLCRLVSLFGEPILLRLLK
jgi:hypothetical protein